MNYCYFVSESTQTQQTTSRRGGYSLRSDSNNSDLAGNCLFNYFYYHDPYFY
jgi:hypothetical protein